MKRFGEKLRTLRTQNGLSYRKMASVLDTSHSHIINLESGKHNPSVDLIVRITQVFDVTFNQLMDDNIELSKKNSTKKEPPNNANEADA